GILDQILSVFAAHQVLELHKQLEKHVVHLSAFHLRDFRAACQHLRTVIAGIYRLFASVVLMVLNALLRPVARTFMPATAPKAIRATTKAYSTRSWPSSRLIRSWNFTYSLRSMLFIFVLSVS